MLKSSKLLSFVLIFLSITKIYSQHDDQEISGPAPSQASDQITIPVLQTADAAAATIPVPESPRYRGKTPSPRKPSPRRKINYPRDNSNYPAHNAVISNRIGQLLDILAKNPELEHQKDLQGNTILHLAAQMDLIGIASTLLSRANFARSLHTRNNDNYTPLMLAIMHNRSEIIKLIWSTAGANQARLRAEEQELTKRSFDASDTTSNTITLSPSQLNIGSNSSSSSSSTSSTWANRVAGAPSQHADTLRPATGRGDRGPTHHQRSITQPIDLRPIDQGSQPGDLQTDRSDLTSRRTSRIYTIPESPTDRSNGNLVCYSQISRRCAIAITITSIALIVAAFIIGKQICDKI